MSGWFAMMAAGAAAVVGGLLALINPVSASVATVTLAGWAFLIVAAVQGWGAWNAQDRTPRIRAGLIAAVAAFLGLSLLLGPFGDGRLMQILIGLLLIGSGAIKGWISRDLRHAQNFPLMLGTAVVSAVMGLVVLFGLNLNFGILLGVELMSSGLAMVLLAMHRRSHG